MLFLITQTHTAESCPVDAGGSKTLYNAQAEGVTVRGIYGAYAEHIIYYLVEADSLRAVHQFLMPGFQRCTSEVRPVSEERLVK
jgi:hypothetical protein